MQQSIRTDLAVERFNHYQKQEGTSREVEGVSHRRKSIHGILVHTMEIENEHASAFLCKPIGAYHTISLVKPLKRCDNSFLDAVVCIAEVLRELLPKGTSYLIACLGNRNITPDAIGPLCAQQIMVTRHLKSHLPDMFDDFSEVSVVCPGVLGTTGIESASLIKGAADSVKPDAVIVIDALAAQNPNSLCNTIQICNTGIEPGSGVGNRRYAINQATLGVPVISLGVPTIVDLSTLYNYICIDKADSSALTERNMMVTPQNIDSLVSDIAKLLSYGINFALHPDLTLEDVDLFIS